MTQSQVFFSATVSTSVKGCPGTGELVLEIERKKECPVPSISPNKLVLVISNSGTEGRLAVPACGGIQLVDHLPPGDKYWLTSHKGCVKDNICPDGSLPFDCTWDDVCRDLKDECKRAKSCEVNGCGGCFAILTDRKGKRVCTDNPTYACSHGTRPVACKSDPCKGLSKEILQAHDCTEWERASACVPDPCTCQPIWIDDLGAQVCKLNSASVCRDVSAIDFGNCRTLQGYAVKNGACGPIHGCTDGNATLLSSLADCQMRCKCYDLQFIDFSKRENGKCKKKHRNKVIGFGVVSGTCQEIRGCDLPSDHPTRLGLFPHLEQCTSTCLVPDQGKSGRNSFIPSASSSNLKNLGNACEATVETFISSQKDPRMETIRAINAAVSSVQAVVYKLEDIGIVNSIRLALRRGTKIQLVVDFEESEGGKNYVRELEKEGADVRYFSAPGYEKLHAKFAVFDGSLVLSGSFNWSESMHKNMEVLMFFRDKGVVDDFVNFFSELRDMAR